MIPEARFLAAALAGLLLFSADADSQPAAGDPDRGETIFQSGTTPRGPLLGKLPGGVELRGELVACATCHGPSGRGNRGGEAAPSIRARSLFQPRAEGTTRAGGRPAYDERALAHALVEGVDPTGRRLSSLMPRFDLRPGELADLTAYLRQLGERPDPGVGDESIELGAVLPLRSEAGEQIARVLGAVLDEANEAGGVFGRRLRLRLEDASAGDSMTRLLDRPVFAMVSGVAGEDGEIPARIDRERLPWVAPLLPTPPDEDRHPSTFFLLPGPAQEARWAVQELSRRGAEAIVLKTADDPIGRDVRRAAMREAEALHLPVRAEATAVIFADGVDELDALAETLPAEAPILVPSALARVLAKSPHVARLRFVHASQGDAPGAYLAFAARHGLSDRHAALSAHAWVAARLAVEALRRTGPDPGRREFVTALATLRQFETGVFPPLTFGPSRRLGVRGARLHRLDPDANNALVAVSDWQSLASSGR